MCAAGLESLIAHRPVDEEKLLVPLVEPRSLRVLLIEDNTDYASLVAKSLQDHARVQFDVDRVATLGAAIGQLGQTRYDAVLLDLSLPDANAETSIDLVCSRTADFPVLVLTACEDTKLALLAGQAGADSFIIKDRLNRKMLGRKIIDAVARHRSSHALELAFEIGASPVEWAPMYAAATTGATSDEERLADELLFCDRLTHTIAQARMQPRRFAVIVLELDHLEVLTKLAGEAARSEMLEAASLRLRNWVCATDTLARIGESSFALIVDDLRSTRFASESAHSLLSCIECVRICGLANVESIAMTASIGVALYPDDGRDLESLLEAAEGAQRQAVEVGGNQVRFCRDLGFYHDRLS